MPWFNVDDGFAFHRKAVKAGNAALGLWTRAGSWCAQQLTDGFVPDEIVLVLGSPTQAAKLVSCGLWHRDDERGGYQFHQYAEEGRNPTREAVLAQRSYDRRKAALQRDKDLVTAVRARDRDRCRYCGCMVNWGDRRSSTGATYDHVDPEGPNSIDNVVVACRSCNSRKGDRTPVAAGMPLLSPKSMGNSGVFGGQGDAYQEHIESEPDADLKSSGTVLGPLPSPPLPEEKEHPPSLRSGPPRKRGTRIPDDFTVTPAMVAWARDRVPLVDGRLETEKFVNYWQAATGKGSTKRDWVATWRNWMLNAHERLPAGRASPTNGYHSQTDQNIHAFLNKNQPDPPALQLIEGGTS